MKKFLLLFCFLAGSLFSQEFGGRGVISLHGGVNLGDLYDYDDDNISAFTGIEGGYLALIKQGKFLYGSDTRLGLRFQDIPYGWNDGDYNFQFYFSATFVIGGQFNKTSLLMDVIGATVGFQPQRTGGLNYMSFPNNIILPLGFHVIMPSGFYLGVRHELYLSYYYDYDYYYPYHTSYYASTYNIYASIGWTFGKGFKEIRSRQKKTPQASVNSAVPALAPL